MKIVIHGAGPSGCTAARVLAELGHTVEVYEVRDTVGGNTAEVNLHGTIVHAYGPHLFHTDDEEVQSFLSRFTEWVPYKHKVEANTRSGVISLPIVDLNLAEPISVLEHPNSEQLYNLVYRDYSLKQWGYQPPKEVLNRVMIMNKPQDGYFNNKYQALPKDGYIAMFNKMLDHPNISVFLNADKDSRPDCDLRVWTGAIDAYHDYVLGTLKYRSLRIENTLSIKHTGAATINECNLNRKFTRSTDYNVLPINNYKLAYNVIQREYPCDHKPGVNEAFYPMKDTELFEAYTNLGSNTLFIGRLAEYKYLDIDKAIKNSLDMINHYISLI